MTRWLHTRRGLIEGREVGGDETWMRIELSAPAPSASMRARGHGPVSDAGETIMVRRAFMRVIA